MLLPDQPDYLCEYGIASLLRLYEGCIKVSQSDMDGNGESEVTVTSQPHHKKLGLNAQIEYQNTPEASLALGFPRSKRGREVNH